MKNTGKKLKDLKTLMELTSLINSTLNPVEIRKRSIEAAVVLLNAEAGSLILIDEESGDLFFEVATGEKGGKLKEVRIKKGEGIAGFVARTGRPLIIHDVQSDKRFFRRADEKSTFTTRNILCVPVKYKAKVIGVLEAINKKKGAFDDYDEEILIALANQVAIAIINANLYHEIKETFYSTVETLAETIELRNPYTAGHTRRVKDYSCAIGRELGLSKKELEDLKLSSILHDIGKIGVPDAILLKEGKLTPEESAAMFRHTEYGSAILNHIRQMKDIIPGVSGHHERYDGKGYPDRLCGADIPMIARIIAVADAFDAMTTDRPYQKALSVEVAFEELQKHADQQFDKNVVNAFIKLWRENRIRFKPAKPVKIS
jgi:HD-GYP domain-containing protein (c-di-GMP phosphodiesterase class II)